VVSLVLAFVAFGAPTLAYGSGFLAVYVAGLTIGHGDLPHRTSLIRVHDAAAWLAQIGMFLMLGLLVFPSRMLDVALPGVILALFLALVARPLVAAICLLPFGYRRTEVGYIGWVGLRGAVPIVLATYPVLAGVPAAGRLFDLVFFIVVANSLIPGATVPWVTRLLGLQSEEPPAPRAILEIESAQKLNGMLLSFYIDDALAVCGEPLAQLPFPDGVAVTMIVRGNDLIPPRGATQLLPGDHVYVLVTPEHEGFVQLIFGRPEAE
jgi:potassium/hydrogen antiporter